MPPRVVLGCEGYFTIHALEYHGCNSNRCSSQHCPGCTQTPALWQLGRTPALPRPGWKDENGWRWMDIHHIFFNHTNQKTWSSKTSDRHASQLTFLSLLLRALCWENVACIHTKSIITFLCMWRTNWMQNTKRLSCNQMIWALVTVMENYSGTPWALYANLCVSDGDEWWLYYGVFSSVESVKRCDDDMQRKSATTECRVCGFFVCVFSSLACRGQHSSN